MNKLNPVRNIYITVIFFWIVYNNWKLLMCMAYLNWWKIYTQKIKLDKDK